MTLTPNTQVVEALFAALAGDDAARANELIADDIAWLNTGLPTIRGRLVRRVIASMPTLRIRFSAQDHDFTDLGDGTVRYARRDTLSWGPLSTTFAVSGTFTVRDGLVHRWDDEYRMSEVVGSVFRRSAPVPQT